MVMENKEMTLKRIFNAPVELVWDAWTTSDNFAQWFGGPPMRTLPESVSLNASVGGRWKATMVDPDGKEVLFLGKFLDVVKGERLVMTFENASDPTDPNVEILTVSFKRLKGKTQVTLHQAGHLPDEQYPKLVQGYTTFMDRMAELLTQLQGAQAVPPIAHSENGNKGAAETTFMIAKNEPEVIVRRVFNAPRETVFKAYTDRSLIPQWWGPAKYTTVVDQLDVKVGGKWRFIQRDPLGKEFGFHGVFEEIIPPQKLVQTFNYEGFPLGHGLVETVLFEDVNGTTKLTSTSAFKNFEDRDEMVGSGMESGARESMERIANLVE